MAGRGGRGCARLHNDVAKIAFTGSTEIGKQMLIYAGQSNMKRVALECGGKTRRSSCPTCRTWTRGHLRDQRHLREHGEVCNAGSRLLLDRPIAEEFIAKFIAKGKTAYQAGDPLDRPPTWGPWSPRRIASASWTTSRAASRRARAWSSRKFARTAGRLRQSTLFTGVNNRMTIAQEEILDRLPR